MAEETLDTLNDVRYQTAALPSSTGKTQLTSVNEDVDSAPDVVDGDEQISDATYRLHHEQRCDEDAAKPTVGLADSFDPIEFSQLSRRRRSSSVPNVHLAETGRGRRRHARRSCEASGSRQCAIWQRLQIKNHEHSLVLFMLMHVCKL